MRLRVRRIFFTVSVLVIIISIYSIYFAAPTWNEMKQRQLKALQRMGKYLSSFNELENQLVQYGTREEDFEILSKMESCPARVQDDVDLAFRPRARDTKQRTKTRITVAFVSCGSRHERAVTMLKSVLLFSQDAELHLVAIGDEAGILDLAEEILCLKWTVNALGLDFTYEMHLNGFPVLNPAFWKKMFRPCSAQRLFLPSLLSHLDAVLYLDTDTIVLANLTEVWAHFSDEMKDERKIAALAANSESSLGFYSYYNHIPYYGTRGLNAGVILMNLTRMRAFKFEDKALEAHTKYRKQIRLADQDIINIVFHDNPENLHQLDCNYNFCGVHCQYKKSNTEDPEAYRFCNATMQDGIRILHGNDDTFHNENFPSFMDLYSNFKKFDLLKDSPRDLVDVLATRFKSLRQLCPPLSAEMMYGNARKYFENLQ